MPPRRTTLAGLAFLAAVAFTVARHLVDPLFLDFGTAIFYPARAFLDGANPYDLVSYLARYPGEAPFPYPPGFLLLALPFGLLDFQSAALLYLALCFALLPVLAALALRLAGADLTTARVLGFAALLLMSRPGHMAVVQGQPSLIFVVVAYAALLIATRLGAAPRPQSLERFRAWAAAAMLALSLAKPTIGAPLAVLFLARGRVRLVATAAVLALGLSMVLVPALAARAGGIGALAHQLIGNETAWTAAQDNHAATSIYRIDAIALATQLTGRALGAPAELALALIILALGAWGVRRFDRARADEATATLMCLTIVGCVYHQTYDALLLMQGVAVLMFGRGPVSATPVRRTVPLLLLCVPFLNHAATYAVLGRLELAGPARVLVTSLNGAAILAAFALYLVAAARARRASEDEGDLRVRAA